MAETLTIEVKALIDDFKSKMASVRADLRSTQKEVQGFEDSVSEAAPQLEGMADSVSANMSQLSDTVSKVSKKMEDFTDGLADSMADVQGSVSEVSDGMAGIGQAAADSAGVASGAVSSIMTSLGPLAAVMVALGAAIKIIQKAWQAMKATFKAWDPRGYARTFGMFERAMRKLRTALGALTAPVVKSVMELATGVLLMATELVEELVKAKSFIEGILGSLIEVKDVLSVIVNTFAIATGSTQMLAFIDQAAKKGKEAAKEVGDAWTEEMSVGLASFDRLNNIGMETGDAAEREELLEDMQEAQKAGEDWLEGIKQWFGQLGDWFSNLNLGQAWDDFVRWGSEALGDIGRRIGDFINWLGGGLSGAWDGFTAWGQNAIAQIGQAVDGLVTWLSNGMSGAWNGFVAWGQNAIAQINVMLDGIVTWMSNGLRGIWDRFVEWGTSAWNSIVSVARPIIDGIKSLASGIWSAFVSVGTSAWNTINSLGQNFINTIIGPIKSFVDWVSGAIQGIVGFVNNIVSGVQSLLGMNRQTTSSSGKTSNKKPVYDSDPAGIKAIGEAVAKLPTSTKKVTAASIQKEINQRTRGAANGETFAPNRPVLRWLGDNNRETEVAAPYSMIVSAVMTALGEASRQGVNQTSNAPIVLDVTLNIDGKKLARMQYDYNQNEITRRNGSGAI